MHLDRYSAPLLRSLQLVQLEAILCKIKKNSAVFEIRSVSNLRAALNAEAAAAAAVTDEAGVQAGQTPLVKNSMPSCRAAAMKILLLKSTNDLRPQFICVSLHAFLS
jgi:hypothetical protein